MRRLPNVRPEVRHIGMWEVLSPKGRVALAGLKLIAEVRELEKVWAELGDNPRIIRNVMLEFLGTILRFTLRANVYPFWRIPDYLSMSLNEVAMGGKTPLFLRSPSESRPGAPSSGQGARWIRAEARLCFRVLCAAGLSPAKASETVARKLRPLSLDKYFPQLSEGIRAGTIRSWCRPPMSAETREEVAWIVRSYGGKTGTGSFDGFLRYRVDGLVSLLEAMPETERETDL
jgi:hypothetical protein